MSLSPVVEQFTSLLNPLRDTDWTYLAVSLLPAGDDLASDHPTRLIAVTDLEMP